MYSARSASGCPDPLAERAEYIRIPPMKLAPGTTVIVNGQTIASGQTYSVPANTVAVDFTVERVAPMTDNMQSLIQQLYGNVGSTNAAYNQANQIVNGLQGFSPTQVNPQTLAGTNLQPYMDPYINAVLSPTMPDQTTAGSCQLRFSRITRLLPIKEAATLNAASAK